jgi:hypothetical protein
MIVILSEAKDLTRLQCDFTETNSRDARSLAALGMTEWRSEGPHKVAMCILPKPIQDKRTKLVECNLEILFPDARSLAAPGMTEWRSEGPHESE